MSWLAKIFGRNDSRKKGPPEQEVEVHFSYGSTNYQHLFALEDVLRHTIAEAGVGHYEGHDVAEDGSDGYYYMYGPDAEAIYRAVDPVLKTASFMKDAKVTLWFGPRAWRTPKRIIQLPS
jgi:hypothetical protein